jgi:hypothetical protein
MSSLFTYNNIKKSGVTTRKIIFGRISRLSEINVPIAIKVEVKMLESIIYKPK